MEAVIEAGPNEIAACWQWLEETGRADLLNAETAEEIEKLQSAIEEFYAIHPGALFSVMGFQ